MFFWGEVGLTSLRSIPFPSLAFLVVSVTRSVVKDWISSDEILQRAAAKMLKELETFAEVQPTLS